MQFYRRSRVRDSQAYPRQSVFLLKKYDKCHFFQAKTSPPRSIGGMKKLKKYRKRESFTLKEDVAKYLLDLSKLVFAGIVLGTVLRYELSREILLTGGITVVILLLIVGLIILGIRKVNHLPTKLETPMAKKTAIKRLKRRKR